MDYRLDLTAACVADIVNNAGGWIADHVAAGWVVTVSTAPHADTLALEILGATVRECGDEDAPSGSVVLPWHKSAAEQRCSRISHRLSAAAKAFKAQALVAAGLAPDVGSNEVFWLVEAPDLAADEPVVASTVATAQMH